MHRVSHLVFVGSISLLACGTSGDDLFGKGTQAGAGGASSSAASSTTGSSSSGGSTSASSGGQGGGPASSAASSGSASASASASSTGTGGGAMLDCGGQSCPQGGQSACCWDEFELNGAPQGECVQGNAMTDACDTELHSGPSGAETRIECETPGQCAGKLCCGKKVFSDVGQYYSDVVCAATCDWPDVTLCDIGDPTFICPMVDDGSGFPQQTICKPSTLLPAGYYVCGL